MLNGIDARSDGKGEFSKDRRKPIPWVDIDTELVVAAADILNEGVVVLSARVKNRRVAARSRFCDTSTSIT
jgi:hypothetical protein